MHLSKATFVLKEQKIPAVSLQFIAILHCISWVLGESLNHSPLLIQFIRKGSNSQTNEYIQVIPKNSHISRTLPCGGKVTAHDTPTSDGVKLTSAAVAAGKAHIKKVKKPLPGLVASLSIQLPCSGTVPAVKRRMCP